MEEARQNLSNLLENFNKLDYNIEEIEERLFAIKVISRKYNVSPDALKTFLEESLNQLNSLKSKIANQAELQVQEVKLNTEYYKLGKNLSEKRLAAARRLEEVLHYELKQLKMEKATFHVNIAESKEPAAYGIDDIVFKASTNPGG